MYVFEAGQRKYDKFPYGSKNGCLHAAEKCQQDIELSKKGRLISKSNVQILSLFIHLDCLVCVPVSSRMKT